MLMKEACTLYLRRENGFERFFVERCHWQESRASSALKSGMTDSDGITVYIPKDALILFPNGRLYPCEKLFPSQITVPESAAEDMVVFGNCPFVFDNSTQQRVSESLRTLNGSYDVHTIMRIDRLFYGSALMQHCRISAR